MLPVTVGPPLAVTICESDQDDVAARESESHYESDITIGVDDQFKAETDIRQSSLSVTTDNKQSDHGYRRASKQNKTQVPDPISCGVPQGQHGVPALAAGARLDRRDALQPERDRARDALHGEERQTAGAQIDQHDGR